jgi:hypothetical protein
VRTGAGERPALIAPPTASATWTPRYTNLNAPTNISTTPAQPSKIFVTEKDGAIRRLNVSPLGAVTYSSTFLDITSRTESNGEAGLLSMVFSPRFAKDGFIFFTYSNTAHDLVLARARALNNLGHVAPTATRISTSTLRNIITINHRAHDNHWGGSLAFGPDGYLYMGTGDGGGSGDTTDSARKVTIPRGKILRLDVLHACNGHYYCVPKTNPLINHNAPWVWLYGVRNPWKMNFDPATRKLWIGDVGQDAYEEVDAVPSKPTVRDLGWPCREGFHSFDPGRCAKHAFFSPMFEIAHPNAESITGGYVIPATSYPTLQGYYVAGDYVTGLIWWFNLKTRVLTSQQLVPADSGGPVAFGLDQTGRIWTVTFSGQLMELRAATS